MSNHNFTLEDFSKNLDKMIGLNDSAYRGRWESYQDLKVKDYTKKEVNDIIRSGNLKSKIELSRNYFNKDGFYRRIVLHYATLLKYTGLLIPNPEYGKKLSNISIQKRYHNAVNFLDVMDIASNYTNWSLRVMRDGSYYGVVSQLDKEHFSILDLPVKYCRTRYKNANGDNIVEFDVSYFDTLTDEKGRKAAFQAYPVDVVNYYEKWKTNRGKSRWFMIPENVGICFQLFDGIPMFLNIIPATMEYDEALATERERDLEEIRKIIVQKIPHLSDGGLLFEPDEAEQMHRGAVGMMKENKNISVLTTYADVEGIVSKTSNDSTNNILDRMIQNIYYEAGTSGQLFASNSNLSLSSSLKNDMALIMMLIYQYDRLITHTINSLFANGIVTFTYNTLPVTWYNEQEYIDSSFKLANSGYSFLIPMVAMGFSQRDLSNLKDLENDVLDLRDRMIPLSSAYNQSSEEGGRPTKSSENKTDKTIANEESLDKGGSN